MRMLCKVAFVVAAAVLASLAKVRSAKPAGTAFTTTQPNRVRVRAVMLLSAAPTVRKATAQQTAAVAIAADLTSPDPSDRQGGGATLTHLVRTCDRSWNEAHWLHQAIAFRWLRPMLDLKQYRSDPVLGRHLPLGSLGADPARELDAEVRGKVSRHALTKQNTNLCHQPACGKSNRHVKSRSDMMSTFILADV